MSSTELGQSALVDYGPTQNSGAAPNHNIRHLRGVPGGGGRGGRGRFGSGGGGCTDDRIVLVTTGKRVPFSVFSVIPSAGLRSRYCSRKEDWT